MSNLNEVLESLRTMRANIDGAIAALGGSTPAHVSPHVKVKVLRRNGKVDRRSRWTPARLAKFRATMAKKKHERVKALSIVASMPKSVVGSYEAPLRMKRKKKAAKVAA